MRRKVTSILLLNVLLFTAVLVVEVPPNASAQVTEEWVARYNGPGNSYDHVYAMTTDSSGNVYVTGGSFSSGTGWDYVTIKYDQDGHELWVAIYNGPGNYDDWARAITIGQSGNVYVTGYSRGIGTGVSDYATVAYDSSGNELWVARYNGPRNEYDYARAIAVNPSGNVYVTGTSAGSGPRSNNDYATVAYDSAGNELWVARYRGPRGENDAVAIATDSSGNVYVTGRSLGSGTSLYDYATIAYDSSGNELWVARYNGPGNGWDEASAIALDSSGNVYVTGVSLGSGTSSDYATVAYDSLGNELWVARYAPGRAEAIAIDPTGIVYVTGTAGSWDFTTVAYDLYGNELWVAKYNGPEDSKDITHAIALDSSGNVYVTGESIGSGTGSDYATVAYDSSGNELWVARYNGLENDWDGAYDIAVDPSGNVYVTGVSLGSGTEYDYATIKYSQQKSILKTTIDIDPDTLNLKSKGRWITAYIELPEGYGVNDIDIKTVMLEDTIPAEWGNVQGKTLMVKFDRSEVQDMLSPGTYNLKVTGELTDGTEFEGYSDEIRVIDPGK